jgi:hypothetical protein
MTTHAVSAPHEPADGPEPAEAPQRRRRWPDAVVVAGIGLLGTLATAAFPYFTSSWDTGTEPTAATATATAPAVAPTRGISYDVAPDRSRSEVVVTGTASAGIEKILILVRSKDVATDKWAESTEVVARDWRIVVPTPPGLPDSFEVNAFYLESDVALKAVTRELGLLPILRETPPPPPPVDPDVACVEQHGEACLNGPGWHQAPPQQSGG